MITQEDYDKLNAKLDMYIQTQNALEKDFREVERKVYKLEQAQGTTQKLSREDILKILDASDSRWQALRERGTALQLGASCLV